MKYIRTDRVQSADFSCLEELKCDIIENLLSIIKKDNSDEVFEIIYILLSKEKAFELFTKLVSSNVNGFYFEIDYEIDCETDLEKLKDEKELVITVSTDGKIWIEKLYPNTGFETNYFYIDNDINSEWFRKVNDGFNEILIFDIDD